MIFKQTLEQKIRQKQLMKTLHQNHSKLTTTKRASYGNDLIF
jgi:hypothetical protein